ncbi:MAG: hypothetical protein ACLTK0_02300 [Anaerovoracaceae bacterium]
MSIVKMQKVAVIGLDKQKESIMGSLWTSEPWSWSSRKISWRIKNLSGFVTLDDSRAKAAELDAKLNQAESVLRFLEKYDTSKEPLFKTRRLMKASAVRNFDRVKAEEDIKSVLDLEEKLRETNEKINKLEQKEILITPWIRYATPLEMIRTPKAVIHEGVVPAAVDITRLMKELEDFGGIVAKLINSDKDLN